MTNKSQKQTKDIVSQMGIKRVKFGPTWGSPLRQHLDYQSIGRRAFIVKEFPKKIITK